MKLSKSLIANSTAVLLVIGGYFSPWYSAQILSTGLFAISGGITNWLAIHMLFEKVPFLIGSGVIPNKFDAFKNTIREMMMTQFFNNEYLKQFILSEEKDIGKWFKADKLAEGFDYNKMYDRLVDAISSTSMGSMLSAFGGKKLFENLRESMIKKLKQAIMDVTKKSNFGEKIISCIDHDALSEDIRNRIETIVDQRLCELTPEMVKIMVQKMIQEHLGWLVVWGVVFGGLIGLLVGFL